MAKKKNSNTYKIYENEDSEKFERVTFDKLFHLVKSNDVGYSDKRHIWYYLIGIILALMFLFVLCK